MSDTKNSAFLFGILSVESRLKILLLLNQKRLCVGALAKVLGITPGAISQHMRLLKHVGLVMDCKCGNFVHYEVNKIALSEALGSLGTLFSEEDATQALKRSSCSAAKCKNKKEP